MALRPSGYITAPPLQDIVLNFMWRLYSLPPCEQPFEETSNEQLPGKKDTP